MIKQILASAAMVIALPAGAVTVTSMAYYTAPAGQHVIDDFDAASTGVGLSGSYSIQTGSSGLSAAPYGDTTNYFSTPDTTKSAPGTATIDFSVHEGSKAYKTVSFYWGSIDAYNTLTLLGTGLTGKTVYTGSDITSMANGDRTAGATNRLVEFHLTPGEKLTGFTLTSTSRAFEMDDIAGSVPEPTMWAMLLTGFGLIGVSLRRRSGQVAA